MPTPTPPQLTPSEDLAFELLSLSHFLGWESWPFPKNQARPLRGLEKRGWVELVATGEGFIAALTSAGREEAGAHGDSELVAPALAEAREKLAEVEGRNERLRTRVGVLERDIEKRKFLEARRPKRSPQPQASRAQKLWQGGSAVWAGFFLARGVWRVLRRK